MATSSLALRGPSGHATLAPPPAGPWTYVDEARTHEVHAHVAPEGAGFRFVTREMDPRDRRRPFEVEARFAEPWEARYHLAELEGRLANLGRYWRHDPPRPGWAPVRLNPAVPRVDLRGLDLGAFGATFHSFRAPQGRDRLLVALPRAGEPLVALPELDFAYPRLDEGALSMLHAGLPAALARSVLAREHVALARRGYGKLTTPADFALAYGPAWRDRVRAAFHDVLARIARGPPSAPEAEPAPPPPEREEVAFDAAVLRDPRLLALHARFLRPDEEAGLLRAGGPAIRRAVASKRRSAAHTDQHRLSVLEASLLARHAVAAGAPVDAASARLLRRCAGLL